MPDDILLRRPPSQTSGAVLFSQPGATLPPDVLDDARQRAGIAGLIYAGTYLLAQETSALSVMARDSLRWQDVFMFPSHLMGLLVIGVAAVFALVTLRSRVSSKRILDLALAFEVVGAFGIMAPSAFAGHSALSLSQVVLPGVPWI